MKYAVFLLLISVAVTFAVAEEPKDSPLDSFKDGWNEAKQALGSGCDADPSDASKRGAWKEGWEAGQHEAAKAAADKPQVVVLKREVEVKPGCAAAQPAAAAEESDDDDEESTPAYIKGFKDGQDELRKEWDEQKKIRAEEKAKYEKLQQQQEDEKKRKAREAEERKLLEDKLRVEVEKKFWEQQRANVEGKLDATKAAVSKRQASLQDGIMKDEQERAAEAVAAEEKAEELAGNEHRKEAERMAWNDKVTTLKKQLDEEKRKCCPAPGPCEAECAATA